MIDRNKQSEVQIVITESIGQEEYDLFVRPASASLATPVQYGGKVTITIDAEDGHTLSFMADNLTIERRYEVEDSK